MASATPAPATDFFATLTQEHAAMEARLKSLDRASTILGRGESDPAALEAVAVTLRYFATEGAIHEAHEEQTLFPRLRPRAEFRQILSALEFQHRMNDDEARALGACAQGFKPGDGAELRRLAARFADARRGHAIAEERALFPLAASVLAPQVLLEMSREMQKRRPPG